MTSRVNVAAASILPWQFPALVGPPPRPPAPEADPDEAVPPPDAPSPGGAAAAEALRAEAARGYADGLAQGRREGHAQGYAAGRAEGRAEAEQNLAALARRLATLLDALAAPMPALESIVEEAVVGLALEVARCVIGSEVSRSREYLVRLIREAIAKVPIGMGAPAVILNPADLELVRALLPQGDEEAAALIADETVEPGGCLVVANAEGTAIKDRRWYPRAGESGSQVDLTVASRWRSVMLALFESEEQ